MTASGDLAAARRLAANAAQMLERIPAYEQLRPSARDQLLADLARIQTALRPDDPYSFGLESSDPRILRNRPGLGRPQPEPEPEAQPKLPEPGGPPKPAATQAVAARAGALLDEIDFPAFVASLIHGTFDAVVDATIRQLEAFADLVSAVAQTVDDFTAGNVTPNQARDWLVERYPGELELVLPQSREGSPTVQVRDVDDFAGGESPAWLSDFDLDGEPLTEELVERQLVPAARRRMGEQRLQMLASMVLLGMNRVTVRDGRISAKLVFRAEARDRSGVDFAVSQDPGKDTWGTRGSETYERHAMMVSTVGVNAQSDVGLRADLYGSVELNFVSQALPLEQFADTLQRTMLQRNARWTAPETSTAASPPATGPAAAVPAVLPSPATPVAAPATPAPPPQAPTPIPAPGTTS